MNRARPLFMPSPQATQATPVPAPNKGINAVDGLVAMGNDEAIFLYNLVPSQYGPRVRTGYREWVTDVGDDSIRSIIPFTGSVPADDRLFACANDGIYDVSSSGTGPTAEISFAVVDGDSGIGVWTNFVNDAGAYFCLYWDETNGYYVYTEASTTWAKIAMGGGGTEISGVDPNNLVFGTLFKNRLWMIERGTGNAWYLAAGSIYGAATKFNFGNKFKNGGYLVALYSWTVDGGEGVDDYLVAIGSGGDVIVYKGSDPATATDWFQHGSYFIGPPPAGRRIAGSFGGELYLLSAYGLLPISKLLSGTLVQQNDVYLSRKISPLINEQMLFTRQEFGWEVKLMPTENLLVVAAPKRESYPHIQFGYSLNTPGWCVYRDLPYLCGDTWHGNFYFGTSDNKVMVHTGNLDNVSLDEETFENIDWSCLQSFQDYGSTNYKRIQYIRPVFLAEQPPSFAVEARYDYNLSEVLPPPSAAVVSGSLWDSATALWDFALWGGDFVTIDPVRGGSGMGRALSIGLNGNSGSKTILIRYDLMADQGGLV